MSIITDNYHHNLHLESYESFQKNDPHLKQLSKVPYIHHSSLLEKLPTSMVGIYTVGGGRQIGKTTLLKQWMLKLLEQGTNARELFFMTGELIVDHLSLIDHIKFLKENFNLKFLIIDEITYIKDWDKGIKFLADAGLLSNIILVLTGSDLLIMQEARMRFPGRRGKADVVDFHLNPLSFFEAVMLKKQENDLGQAFSEYLQHGGFLSAINEFRTDGKISESTYRTYSDWVRGDILKKNKQESYLRNVVKGIITRYGSQITWNSLAKELPIDHPATIIDYVTLLERSDVCFVLESFIENKLSGAPKKARKVYFKDPFILRSLAKWIGINDIDSNIIGAIIESVVVAHHKRYYDTYYINAEGEVDLVYVKENHFFPIEVKWTEQIRSKDLKQIRKYKNGEIWGSHTQQEANPPIYYLPQKLFEIR